MPTANNQADGFKDTDIGLIPAEWEVVPLGNLARAKYGKAKPKSEGDVPVIGSGGTYAWVNEALVDFPTLVIGRKGTAGRAWLMERSCWPSDTTFYLEWTEEVDVQFLYGYLTLRPLSGEHAKTTIPSLSRPDLENYPIPLPPLAEQRRIAHVLSTIQRAIAAQKDVIAAARELKRSLMQRLFTYGPVTQRRGGAEAPRVDLKETEIGPIPAHWEVVRFEDFCAFLQYGTSRRCSKDSDGTPVLRIPNVIEGRIDLGDFKFIRLPEKSATRLKLEIGDLLFVRTNGRREYTGRSAVFQGEPPGSLFASYLIRARLKPHTLSPDFVQIYTMTSMGKAFLSGRATGAADGKYNINQQTIKSMLVPVPPLTE